MSQAFHGADPGALRAQASALHEAAQTLTTCAQRTGAALDALAWHGHDAARTRDEWPTQHARTLLTCAAAMQEAAQRLLDDADAQEAASGVTGAGSAGGSAGGGATGGTGPVATSPTAGAALRAALDTAHDATSEALERIGTVATATDLGLLGLAARRWENVATATTAAPLGHALSVMQDAHIGPATGAALQGAAVLGVASDAYGAVRAHHEGDLHGTVDNAVSAVIGAGGFVPGGAIPSMALGLSWDAGTAVGTLANEAMQGTAFHDRFTQRMDTAFDVGGAWGMLNTPGALIVTGAEEVTLRTQEAWQGLTGAGDGTLDTRR